MDEKMTFEDYVRLFDFYAPLLSVKQREAFDLHYNEDLSLSEIAEHMDMTRQGVGELIRTAQKRLVLFESKLRALKKIDGYKNAVEYLMSCSDEKIQFDRNVLSEKLNETMERD